MQNSQCQLCPFNTVPENNECVCPSVMMYMNTSGRCECKQHAAEINGTCACVSSEMSVNTSGNCICPAPKKAESAWTHPTLVMSGEVWAAGTGGVASNQENKWFVRKNWLGSEFVDKKLSTWTFTTEGACTVQPFVAVKSNDDTSLGVPQQYYAQNIGTPRTVTAAGTYTFPFDDQSTTRKGYIPNGFGPHVGWIVTGGANCISTKPGSVEYYQYGSDIQNKFNGMYASQYPSAGPHYAVQFNAFDDTTQVYLGTCESCKAGQEYYSANNTCSLCGPLQTSDPGASKCKCALPGYHMSNGVCVECPANSFCPDEDLVIECPPLSSSPARSYQPYHCKCIPTHYNISSAHPSGMSCAGCLANNYCPGDNSMRTCTANSTSLIESSSLADCTCNPSRYAPPYLLEDLKLSQYFMSDTSNSIDPRIILNGQLYTDGLGWSPLNGWTARGYIIVDMLNVTTIQGVATGGWVVTGRYVATSKLEISNDGVTYTTYMDSFPGKLEISSVFFYPPIQARYLKFTPTLVVSAQNMMIGVFTPRGTFELPRTCELCPNTSYCPGNIPVACPDDSMSLGGAIALEQCSECKTGYLKSGPTSCRPCSLGSYCPNKLSEQTCPNNTFSNATALTKCLACQDNSTSAPGSDAMADCNCNPGFTLQTIQNRACSIGVSNYGYCIPFERNILHFTGVNNALQEPAVTIYEGLGNTGNINTWINPDMMIGEAGGNSINMNVQAMKGTTVQLDLRSARKMGNFYFFTSSYTTRLHIWVGNSTSSMKLLVELARQAEIGNTYFSMVQDTNGVTARYLWFYFPGADNGWVQAGCFQLDSFRDEGKRCAVCPKGAYCVDGQVNYCPVNTTSAPGSIYASDCSGCVAGYIKDGATSCRPCKAGYYCSNSSLERICTAGSASPAASTACTTCAANTFADASGMSTCTACPLNSASVAGSTAKSACNCNAGYYRDIDNNCIACPAGYKCTGNNLMSACIPGTYAAVGKSACTSCSAGTYSDVYAMGACLTCPAGTTVVTVSEVVIGSAGSDRTNHPSDSNFLYIQRKPLPATSNLTKWSFYAFDACTITPVIADTVGAVSNSGYDTITFTVTTVGTKRTVPVAGAYTFDFLANQMIKTKALSYPGGGLIYNQNYLGWFFEGPGCIPYDTVAPDQYASNDFVVQKSTYNASATWASQTFTSTITTRQNMRYSVSITTVAAATVFSSAAASTSIFNCSCGSGLRQLSDGNCQGLCVDGKYMAQETDATCTTCPQGSYCTKSVRTPCPTDTSALPGSAQCITCVGPNTHSDVSLATCGIKACAAATPVALAGTTWKALGRVTLGLGGNGVIPTTPWFAAYKCLGLVLNATADRPVTLLQHTLTVTPNQSYALRFKVVCTGAQCGAAFTVSQGSSAIYSTNTVARTWTEAATPYFTTTGTSVTIQFRAQMVTSSCTIWLAQVELVDLGQWTYPSVQSLQLRNGAFLPVRYSAAYSESQQLVPMQISATGYLQQQVSVLANNVYEMLYWKQGAVDAFWNNGTDWILADEQTPFDTATDWTQRISYITPATTQLSIRFVGPGTLSPPSLSLYTEPASRPCKNCIQGYWCRGATLNKCPLNTNSSVGSSLQTDCFCIPGYYGQVQLGEEYGYSPCAICPMNYHCDGGNQMAPCPPGTKSQPGSALDGCKPCDPGEFCENGLVGVCPANSYAPAGSNDIGDCGCMPGYYGTMGSCTLCESGFYCPGGTGKLSCTANAVSPPGSTDPIQCFCGRGYYGVNNTACQACPEGYWCWTGVRNTCPANAWSPLYSSYQVNCTCTYGYTGPDGEACAACSQGYYKTERGPGSCTACGNGTSSTATAATSPSVCALCNRGHFNPYIGQSACLACDAGTSAGDFGSVSCATCPAGGWSAAGAASCVPCVGGTFSVTAGAADVSTCAACPAGSWSAASSLSCNQCGTCSFWSWPMRVTATLQGTSSLIASINSNSQTFMTLINSTTAVISEGFGIYYLHIATGAYTPISYEAIEQATYTHVEASRDRTSIFLVQSGISRLAMPGLYLMNYYSTNAPMGCTEGFDGVSLWVTRADGLLRFNIATEVNDPIIPYPSSLTGVTASPCMHSSYPDFVFLSGRAGSSVFGFRKYKISTKTWSVVTTTQPSLSRCTFTPDGNFVVFTSVTGSFLYSMTEDTIVRINTNIINGVLVDPQSAFLLLARQSSGILRQPVLIQDSRNCGPGLYSASGGLSSAAQCETCPAGSLCPGGANITQCVPGTYSSAQGLREQGQCLTCPAGRYCLGGTSNQLCPLGSYSLAAGVTRLADCGACPAGFYCPNTTSIVACPSNTFSPAGSSDLASCTCNAGYKCEVVKVIHAEITLPVTVVQFEDLRQAYINAVAAAAGVDPSQVIIVSVTSTTGSARRRLLASDEFAEIHTSIYGSRHVTRPMLAIVALQRHLVLRGLPKHESNTRVTLHKEVTHSMRQR